MKSGTLTVMLLLSAIDLLTSALVSGVVLMVVLVGGDPEEARGAGQRSGGAPLLLEVISAPAPSGEKISLDYPAISSQQVSGSVTWLGGGEPFYSQSSSEVALYNLPAAVSTITLRHLLTRTAVRVYAGAAGTFEYLLRCDHAPWDAEISLDLQQPLNDTCTDRRKLRAIDLPKQTRKAFALVDAGIAAAGWRSVTILEQSTLLETTGTETAATSLPQSSMVAVQ